MAELSSEDMYRMLEQRIRTYLERAKQKGEVDVDAELARVRAAYDAAVAAHEGQKRQSGEDYIIHPLQVALILADLELDMETIMAGLLHDVAEDTDMSLEDIRIAFGHEVAELVDGVTKLKHLTYTSNDKEEIQAENYRKMFVAMAKDIRVILIKLADRLHNMRTLEYKSHEKQLEKAKETLDIYAPLANRLGISKIKVELDDLSLKYLEPEVYQDLTAQVADRLQTRTNAVSGIEEEIKEKLTEAGIEATVTGRQKHYFSIYKKMVTKGYTLDQIYDLLAVRVLVNDIKDCYGVLGIIHEMYTPVPGRFKDYIAMPKSNMYQSLHTTLIGPEGEPFEVQIRTWEMHQTAEYGIAAHWKYKEAGSTAVDEKERMAWLQKILEWQNDLSDNREFMDTVKQDLDMFQENVYCFSPAGKVLALPSGSTPIDFAYQIHSAVGDKMVGARVNGRIVTMDYKLQNGDRVEIITSQNSKGPSRDWLKIVATSGAKSKINQWFKRELKQENIVRGKDALEKYIKAKSMPSYGELCSAEAMQSVMQKYSFTDWDSVLATIGYGGLKEGQVGNRLLEEYQKAHPHEATDEEILEELNKNQKPREADKSSSHSPIVVRGIHDVAVRFSRCCGPLPGDDIVGFVTRGRGISIHRTDCVNIRTLPEDEKQRLIDASWDAEDAKPDRKFIGAIQIEATEEQGLLATISTVISNQGLNVDSISARRTKDHSGSVFNVSVEITDKSQLEALIRKLAQVPGVHKIIRTSI